MNRPVKVIELRNYLLKPGTRDRFIEYFERHFVESQNALGGFVLGAYRIADAPDRFFWIRGFSDMATRSRFLHGFYSGDVWKKRGPAANEMMLEWHNVYLLKPLGEIGGEVFPVGGPAKIDIFYAKTGQTSELIAALQSNRTGRALWTSELAINDFPRLPVIQDETVVAAIANYRDDAAEPGPEPPGDRIAGRITLKLRPTAGFAVAG